MELVDRLGAKFMEHSRNVMPHNPLDLRMASELADLAVRFLDNDARERLAKAQSEEIPF